MATKFFLTEVFKKSARGGGGQIPLIQNRVKNWFLFIGITEF